ncbi:MAG TPA: hypothetical protein VF173_11290 [Thermoanaerobaculia bacterium]|nr:hypothetical protein [Thermoanaerobaculia bacterium]
MRAPRVQETDNLAAVTVDGEYRFSERFTAGFQVPLGAVAYIDKNDHLLGIYDHYRFGIGDVTAWASTAILRETATRPLLTAVASVDSGSSRYSSLGDGFASCGLGVTGYKSLTSRFYVTGEATAIKRFAKDGLDPGILAVPGLGGGLLTPKGNYRIEVVSEYLWSSKASSEPGEVGGSKLSLSVRLRGAATRYSLQVDIFGFDHLSRGGYGFSLNYPLYPREKFRS